MPSEITRLNRATLYDQVWSQPITTVAKAYGVSNVGLAKICARLRVPRPPRGYWQRLKFGKTVRKPPLPTLREGESEEHVMERHQKPPLEPGTSNEFEVLAAQEKDPAKRIVVPEDFSEPHVLVAKAEKSLRQAGTDQFGLLRSRAEGRLAIWVSRASLDRALKIMNALVKALEARELKVSVTPGEDGYTSTSVLGEEVPFWIEEIVDAIERPLTPKEEKDKEQNPWRYRRPIYNQVPSGRLALRMGSAPDTGIRRTVADSPKHRVDDSLNKFVELIVLGAAKQQSERFRRERQEREWAEQRRLREEQERRQYEDRQRAERLTQQMNDWERSRRIREFIADMREMALQPDRWKIGDVPLPEWMSWALDYADRIDPVAPIRKARQVAAEKGPETAAFAQDPHDRP